jgi:hypothetical protein
MKIAMYDLEGHLLEVFTNISNVKQFERDMGYKSQEIYNCINNKQLQSNNRQFRKYTDNDKPHQKIGDISKIQRWNNKSVCKYYKGKYVCSYPSLNEAGEINNLDPNHISNCCAGREKTSGGFEWKYSN